MTVKDEYNKMKSCFRIWNNCSNWDDTPYIFFLEHYTKRSKTMFLKLLNQDFENMNFDLEHGIITVDQYNKKWKVWNDCSRSIANMNII